MEPDTDPHQNVKSDLDQEPHPSGKSEPDLRQKEKLDPHPDSHHFDAASQHCLCEIDFCIIVGISSCQKVFVVLTN
jgi:hypothetical protein